MRLNFRELGNFPEDNRELKRAIGQLEDNVAEALKKVEAFASVLAAPTNIKTASYSALVDELVVTDTSNASLTVTLPDATPLNAGHDVSIIRTSASNTLTARAVGSKVQGGAAGIGEAVPAAAGLYVYRSSGRDWWRR